MKDLKNKSTITINIEDLKLRIIRVGLNPELKVGNGDNIELRRLHSHFTYEALFVTQGCLKVKTQKKITAFERKVVIVPPNMGHFTIPSNPGCYCLLFSIERSPKSKTAALLNEILKDDLCSFDLSDDLAHYIRTFARKSSEDTPKAEKVTTLLAELIFIEIISAIMPSLTSLDKSIPESWYIGAIETFININIANKITLSDVAKHMHLSVKHVSRIIRQEYGVPLSELITERKLQSAQMFLETTDIKIKNIAEMVNLGAENYFYSVFKKKYGMSPMEYRKQYKKEEN